MKKMRILMMLVVLSLTMSAQGQTKKEKAKQAKLELKEKASKAARKEAKTLKKQGWAVSPGAIPMEKQLDRSYMFELDVDDEMNPVYVIGNGQSIGENYDAAYIQATELARMDLAGNIGSEATSLIDNLVANKQLAQEQAASITTTMMESKTIFSQKLGRVQVAVSLNRVLKNGNKEVMVRLVAKESSIKEIAKQAIRDELEKDGKELSEELKTILSRE